MKLRRENKNISPSMTCFWQENKKIKKVSKNFFIIVFALILSMATLYGHFCFALTSSNYTITADTINSGGVYSTSTNYTIIDYIVNGLSNLFRPLVTTPPYTGGGDGAPTPTPTPPTDTTAPIISNVQVLNITQSSARITWTTDENSSTFADYGKTLAYEVGSQTGLGGATTHEILLSGLNPNTSYHFRVRSADAAGNSAQSLDQIFTTTGDILAPVISSIVVTNITGNSATINWTTNESANSYVDYGVAISYELGTQTDSATTTSHSINLTGLNPSTLYNFRVRSSDEAGNNASSLNQTFTTLDTVAPVISGIRAVGINSNSATILWTTDETSSGSVGYGLTSGYESGVGMSAIFSRSHQIPLSDLMGNTLYHFRVTATDPADNNSYSTDFTFRTLGDGVAPSNVLNFRADPGESFIILSWTNPTDRDFAGVHIMRSATSYPLNSGDGTVVFHGLATSAVDRGLMQGTAYYYTAFSYDTSENFSSGAVTFTTTLGAPSIPPSEPEAPPAIPPVAILEAPPGIIPPGEAPPTMELPSLVLIEITDFQFLVANETLSLPIINNQIKTITATQMIAVIDVNKFSKIPEAVMLKIGDSNYIFDLNGEKKRFETIISAPFETGSFNSDISIVYDKENFQFISFKLNVVSAGFVYETVESEKVPVDGALVTIYRKNSGGQMEIWGSGSYAQTNPVFTNSDGAYYFLAPDGFYQLKTEKESYRSSETPIFEINDVIVNKGIELLLPPKKILEVIEPEAPLAENIQNIAENIGEQTVYQAKVATEEVKKVIDNPTVEKANEQIALPAVATVAVANASAAISLLNLLNYFRFLITQPFLLLNRRKQKGWGKVYHSFSKLPIDLAIVRLLDAKTKKVIQTRVTDKEGRYAFIVSEGRYLISVAKPGFVFPSKYLKNIKVDAGMMDIYHGEIIDVGKEGVTITANIPLDPIERVVVPKRVIFRKWFVRINHAIAISGIFLALGSFIISPSAILGGFLAAQIILYFLFRRLSLPKRPRTWGIVYDRKTREPLKQVITRIFESKYNKLLETQVSDGRGRYVFLVGKSAYYVTFEKAGYETRKTDIINFEKAKNENYVAMDIGLSSKL